MAIETVSIGKIVATHGVKGGLVVEHGLGKKSVLEGVKAIFLEDKSGSRIPYFLTGAIARTTMESLLQLEGIETREQALQLLQKKVWLLQEDFQRLVAAQSTIALIGYQLKDNGKLIGTIDEVIEQPHQVLCVLHVNEKEVLVPLHENSLQRIDRKKKEVHVILPDGLLEVYLGEG